MPVVLRAGGFRFFFYSNEGDPREPLHVHVRQGASTAKLWLEPEIRVAGSYGFDAHALRRIAAIVTANRAVIERGWHEHFG